MSDMSEEIQANVREAQVFSRKHMVLELDFSPTSVHQIEEHIDSVDYAIPGGKSEENLAMLTRTWGCYLGECLKRQVGGEWVGEESGDQPMVLRVADQTLDPLGQVRKRLIEGAEHNLWEYFQTVQNQF